MGEIIIMPKQGLQMTEGMISTWLIEEGQAVKEGEPLFEMETDKLAITIDATTSGTLLKILAEEGEIIPVAEPIAVIGEPGENYEEILTALGSAPSLEAAPKEAPPQENVSTPAVEPASKESDISPVVVPSEEIRVFASPRARTRATERGIDYRNIPGTGPLGMVIERDVLNAKTAASKLEHKIPISSMRRIIAQRMQESLHTLAQANHRLTVDMTAAVELRKQLQAMDIKVSYNDIVIRCTAKALTEFPMMNAMMDEQFITTKDYVNIGMAVATDNGLLVPVIRDADLMTLPEISRVSKDLAARTKENKLTPDELSGGTFTISNLGMFDIESFTAIINKPEAGILAVGKMEKKPVVKDDEIVIRPLMQLSLTYDHRIVDGAPAALFLRRIKQFLEAPGLLI